MNKQNRNELIDTENKLMVIKLEEVFGELGGWVQKVKGLSGTNWHLRNSHMDVKRIY